MGPDFVSVGDISIMIMRRLWAGLRLLSVGLVFVALVGPEWPSFQDERYQLRALVGPREFDFVVWEANALLVKGEAALVGGQRYLDEQARKAVLEDYLALTGRAAALRGELELLFSDPATLAPLTAAAPLETELADVRARMAELQPVAEAVLEEQVAAVLVEERFDLLGQAWPPVQAHLTQLPFVLAVSPRDEIRQAYSVSLVHGLTAPEKEALEAQVLAELNLAALVVPIGGVGIFPAMVVESGNLSYLANTFAHEWAHHWLTLHPLGLSYAATPQMRTVNETVASIVGDEIGAAVMAQFYPELLPPAPVETRGSEEPAGPPPFDFRAEMRTTRVEADRLLAAGRVAEAEAYMEARRQIFWDNGYRIRKLNQAYFAFYGAYADTPGATGGDPVGPTVLAIRALSPSLRDFLDTVAQVTSFEQLQQVLAELQRER
jgi:hypothetical protein